MKIFWNAIAIFIILAAALTPESQADDMSRREKNNLADSVSVRYTDWNSVELNGKLKADGLPVNPSVRVYMVRDSLIDVSIRAPFVGEVARIRIDDNNLLAYNKMKNVYWEGPMTDVLKQYPAGISDLQSLLLGRMVILGEGEVDRDSLRKVDVFEDSESGGWLLMPQPDLQPFGVSYGYVVNDRWLADAMVVEINGSDDFFQIDYLYSKKGYTLAALLGIKGKRVAVDLKIDEPKWGASPMSAIKLNKNAKKVSLKEVIKF